MSVFIDVAISRIVKESPKDIEQALTALLPQLNPEQFTVVVDAVLAEHREREP